MPQVNQKSITPLDMADILRFYVKRNRSLQKTGKMPVSVEIIGEHGIGKTAIPEQIAREFGIPFYKLNLTSLQEVGDLIGLPITKYQVTNPDGKKVWAPEKIVEQLITQGYVPSGKTRTFYSRPFWAGMDKGEGGILMLDDSKRADTHFQQAVMELVDKQECMGWSMPPGWTIVLTNNPSNSKYIQTHTDDAQETRKASYTMRFDVESWSRWAERNVDSRCINFIIKYVEAVDQNPIRMWTKFFDLIGDIENFHEHLDIIGKIGVGLINDAGLTLFTEFISNRLDELPDHTKLFQKDDLHQTINVFKKTFGDRGDVASVIANRYFNHIYHETSNRPFTEEDSALMEQVLLENIFPFDSTYAIINNLYRSDHRKFRSLVFNKKFAKFLNN